jgi:immunity protein Imm1 of predicted polymorphic toxin system
MVVCDIASNETTVNNLKELDAVLMKRRSDGANAFWLVHDAMPYPRLALLVNGDLGFVNYFPEDRDAGYIPTGNLARLPAQEMSKFPISEYPADDLVLVNDAVLPISVAVQVAHEFFQSDALPKAITWEKL